MSDQAIEMSVSGLKCDANGCGYQSDVEISRADYEKWTDAPCPKCGASLLTKADYDCLVLMEKAVGLFNKAFGPGTAGEKKTEVSAHMNGSGSIQGLTIKE